MDRAALRAAAMGEKKEGGGGGDAAGADGGAGAAASRALQQCGQLQKLIDISIGSLRGLRTKCSVSNDLTQQEIRTLEAKLLRYICKQWHCKLSVAPGERTSELDSYPRFSDWLYTFNVRPDVVQEILRELTLDALLDMNEAKVKETLRRCGASAEECGRLQYALTCLRKVTGLGGEHKEDSGWSSSDARRESGSGPPADTLSPASLPWPPGSSQLGRLGSSAQGPRSVSVSALPASDSPNPGPGEGLSDTFISLHASGRLTPRALPSFITPPTTPQLRRHTKLKPPRTPPPPSRKVFQLLPSFPTLTRSKSHESQLGNRIDEVSPMRFDLPHGSPQMVRRDIGLSVTHRRLKARETVWIPERPNQSSLKGFPGTPWWPSGKNLPCNAADMGSILGWGTETPHSVGQLSLKLLKPLKRVCAATKDPNDATRTRHGQINT